MLKVKTFYTTWEDALPIIEEHTAGEALRILLSKHDYPQDMVDSSAELADKILIPDSRPEVIYCAYVQSVTNIEVLAPPDFKTNPDKYK